MVKAEKKGSDFEILLSTMNRTSLSFLQDMFPKDDFKNYSILIINQTSKDKQLKSDSPNVRVINSFEKGLSKSRNLAIKNGEGTICLIADDDVKYKTHFKKIILEAFKKHHKADILTFQIVNKKGELYNKFPNIIKHNKNTVSTVNSVAIALKRKKIIENNSFFNENFGLGSAFETADEYVFLRSALRKGLKLFFEPKVILMHPNYSSGRAVANDKIIYARSAVFYKYNGLITYLKLGWHLFLLIKNKELKSAHFFKKYQQGLKGINDYKSLLKQGIESRKS
ncbi:glycosyltransferase family A protein [Yeosuana marina]|uniref:glycosyltransferase family A protein n=1 Tax=Yeosuana marina TaxID=1565536 RepID=UPI0030C7F78D